MFVETVNDINSSLPSFPKNFVMNAKILEEIAGTNAKTNERNEEKHEILKRANFDISKFLIFWKGIFILNEIKSVEKPKKPDSIGTSMLKSKSKKPRSAERETIKKELKFLHKINSAMQRIEKIKICKSL